MEKQGKKILVVDVGGTHIKVLATGRKEPVKIPSGPKMTPKKMVKEVREATKDWNYSVVSIGYPGPVVHGHPSERTAQSRRRLGRIRFSESVWAARENRE